MYLFHCILPTSIKYMFLEVRDSFLLTAYSACRHSINTYLMNRNDAFEDMHKRCHVTQR